MNLSGRSDPLAAGFSKTQASPGIKMIADVRSHLVAGVMKELYAAILEEIERLGFTVCVKRAYVPMARKIALILNVILKGRYV